MRILLGVVVGFILAILLVLLYMRFEQGKIANVF